jgi:hypothetical protein
LPPRSGLERSDLVQWHISDLPSLLPNVGYQGKSGSDSDIVKPSRLTLSGHRFHRLFEPIVSHFSLAAQAEPAMIRLAESVISAGA